MKILSLLILAAVLSGCSVNRMWYGSDVARLSYVKVNGIVDEQGKFQGVELKNAIGTGDSSELDETHIGALIAWSPEFNAAFISSGGNGCIQPATYSKLNSGNAELPAEILSSGVTSGKLSGDFSQALDKLIKVSDQSTFLSIGLYGLCQLHANNGLTNEQLSKLTQELFDKAASANGSSQSNDTTDTENQISGEN